MLYNPSPMRESMPDIHIHIHGDGDSPSVKTGATRRPKASKGAKGGKPKRKASAYSKRYGAAYKRLKKKHPRSSFGALSKKAHKQARK